MTTHETQPEFLETAAPGEHAVPMEHASGEHTSSMEHAAPMEQEPVQQHQTPVQQHEPVSRDHHTDQTLFGDGELSDLRSRWTEVQAQFVDDPRDCVQKADGLVSDVVDRLTSGFAQARSGLEEQWSRGEEASTEDLRIALQRYRDFFERLLAV